LTKSTKQYQYILLDWDGNLAQTLQLWFNAIRIVLDEEGFQPSDEEIAESFGKIDDYFAHLGIKDPRGVFERVNQLAIKELPGVELYPNALEVLAYLKDISKKTALITTSPRANIEHLLDRYDMHRLFDVIVTGNDVTKHKPDPESLLVALEVFGGNPAEALMIGDSDKDLGAAQNAGIDSILFYPPEHTKFYNLQKLKQLNPTYVVEDFREIMTIVQ